MGKITKYKAEYYCLLRGIINISFQRLGAGCK